MTGSSWCTCQWNRPYDGVGMSLENRDPNCQLHGDGTPAWDKIQQHAEDLAERLKAEERTATLVCEECGIITRNIPSGNHNEEIEEHWADVHQPFVSIQWSDK